MSGTGSLMGSYESTERLLARFMPEDKVGADHGGNPRSRRPHHVGQAGQCERDACWPTISRTNIPRPFRWCCPRSSRNMPRACWAPCPRNSRWKWCSACCAWKACRRTFSTRSNRPCASNSCPTWRAPPSATPMSRWRKSSTISTARPKAASSPRWKNVRATPPSASRP